MLMEGMYMKIENLFIFRKHFTYIQRIRRNEIYERHR